MKFYCKFCGSRECKNIGGQNGDPFDQRPEKWVCCGCGRVLFEGDDQTRFDTEAVLKEALHGKRLPTVDLTEEEWDELIKNAESLLKQETQKPEENS